MKPKHKKANRMTGLVSGIVNGLLGAGGGMLIVPALKKEIEIKKAHATTVAVIMPMCLASSMWYIFSGRVTLNDALPYVPFGIVGSLIGSFLLTKIKSDYLRIIFNLFMIWAGIRMLTR